MTWPPLTDTSESAWQKAVADLKKGNRTLVRAVQALDDEILEKKSVYVRGPYYLMLHGTIQHSIYHAGQISLLRGQMVEPENRQDLQDLQDFMLFQSCKSC
jgi:hypothetical protein